MDFSMVIFSVVFTILLLFITTKLVQNLCNTNMKKGKKKTYHPIGGSVISQLWNFNRLHHYMTRVAGKHRTFRMLRLFNSDVYTVDPANVEYILKTNFQNYGKGPYHYSVLGSLLGDGIFTVDGDKWRQQRKISSHEFSARMLRDYSREIFQKKASELANIISTAAKTNETIDIQDLFLKCTMDSIIKIALGVELDTMSGLSEDGARFDDAFDHSSAITLFRYLDAFWKIKKIFNTGSERALHKKLQVVDEFVYKIINNKNQQAHISLDGSYKEDILSRFKVVEKDPKYLRDILLSFIIAGRDTTAVTLSWFIYMVCKHPNVQEKVVEEIKMATGLEEATGFVEFAESLTDSSLEKMQYLHATLTETLRLYPAIPLNGKFCFEDDTLPDGFHVKKGSLVVYIPYAMGRMQFIWGDDAESFRPERWLDENGCLRNESPFKFTAFQAGPRICLGKEFAYRQMKIFAAVVLGCFRMELRNQNEDVNYRTMLSLQIDGGLYVRATLRQKIL